MTARAENTPKSWFDPWPPTPEMRRQIVEYNVGLVERHVAKIARRLPPHVRDDALSEGFVGLMRAVDNFNPDANVHFESYAASAINSRVLDFLRSLDPASRTLRAAVRDIIKAEEELLARHGRTPTDAEVASHLSLTTAKIRQTRAALRYADHTSIDLQNEDGEPSVQLPDSRATSPEATVITQIAVDRIAGMTKQHRTVLALHYYGRHRLQDIASMLQLPEAKVSELHAEAVATVRECIAAALSA